MAINNMKKSQIQINIHQTHHSIADFLNIKTYLTDNFKSIEDQKDLNQLHIFPELFLSGYPLQDLCLKRSFILSYQKLLAEIDDWSVNTFGSPNNNSNSTLLLLGGLRYTLDKDNWPYEIRNVIYKLIPGKKLEAIYTKILLPNYDIFDEKKYFTPGETPTILEWQNYHFALMICEDMWPSSAHKVNTIVEIEKEIKKNNINLDLIINLSAGPYHINKNWIRINQGKYISNRLKAPFVYVNRVGGEDEIIFDGQSFLLDGDRFIIKANAFKEQILSITQSALQSTLQSTSSAKAKIEEVEVEVEAKVKDNIWAQLYSPDLVNKDKQCPPTLPAWNDGECQEAIDALIFGLKEYAKKSKFNNFLVALSGGMDSSLVLTLANFCIKNAHFSQTQTQSQSQKQSQKQKLEAIFMPSKYSSTLSYELSKELCKNLGVPLYYLPIKFLHSSCQNAISEAFGQPLLGLADENIQSRLRGMLLYSRSNQTNALVINTSNKSELAVGYSTMYGDSVGGISLLGDLYKTEVYQLANYINRAYNNLIPSAVIDRAPSAELRENQTDEMSLPPYHRLDAILEGILSYHMTASELIHLGFNKDEVTKTFKLYFNSEYKRKQFAPIIKIKSKSFGFGYRVPINKDNNFYSI